MRRYLNNDRDYRIHLNLHKDANTEDILKSYYFARILDKAIQDSKTSEQSD